MKTLDPAWNDTFDLPLGGVNTSTVECVCWDKDIIGKASRRIVAIMLIF
jgi:phosphatidylserine decarboxylase